MNVLLTSCRSPFLDDDKIYVPLANLYLKSFLAKHAPQHSVTIGDDNYDCSQPETFSGYDAVGISIMTPQRAEANKFLYALKTHSPQTVVIAGGPHCRYYTSSAEEELFDHVVPADGERSLVQILNGGAPRVVRTSALSAEELLSERNRIVMQYNPKNHKAKWSNEDKFFQTHEANA